MRPSYAVGLVLLAASATAADPSAPSGAATFGEYANPADREAAAALEAALDRPLPDLSAEAGGKAELPCRDLIAAVGRAAGIAVALDENALTDAGVSVEEAEPVPSFPDTPISVRAALELILEDFDLTWVNRAGVLWVTTTEVADDHLVTRVYDVSDLLAAPPPDSDAGPDGVLTAYVQQSAGRWWLEIDGVGGSLAAYGGRLVVRQTQAAHREVAGLLAATRQALAAGPTAGAFEGRTVPEVDRAAAAALEAALDRPLPDLGARGDWDMPRALRDLLTKTFQAAGVDLLVDELALNDAGVSLDVEVTVPGGPLSTRAAVELLLGPRRLDYVNRAGVLVVTSSEVAEEQLVTRIYNVRDLLEGVPAKERLGHWQGQGYGLSSVSPSAGGDAAATEAETSTPPAESVREGGPWVGPNDRTTTVSPTEQLIEAIHNCTSGPWFDIDGTGGVVAAHGEVIAVKQTQRVHREVASLFAGLREARAQAAPAEGADGP